MAVLLHAVSLAGVCRMERTSPVPQVRARPEEMRCVGSKRTRELGRATCFIELLGSCRFHREILGSEGPWEKSHCGTCARALYTLAGAESPGKRGRQRPRELVAGGGLNAAELSGTVQVERDKNRGAHAPPKFGGGRYNWRSLHIEPTQTPKSSTRHSVPPLPPKTKLAPRLRPDCAETGWISRALEVGRDVKL